MYNVDIPTILLRSNDGGNVNDVWQQAERKHDAEFIDMQIWSGLKITGDRSPVKMTGQLDFSSVKIRFWLVIDTPTLSNSETNY
jgi:hypothetical protein